MSLSEFLSEEELLPLSAIAADEDGNPDKLCLSWCLPSAPELMPVPAPMPVPDLNMGLTMVGASSVAEALRTGVGPALLSPDEGSAAEYTPSPEPATIPVPPIADTKEPL